jgi:hypothetical protein
MKFRSMATAAAALALTVAVAPAAMANSFDDPVGGGGHVVYTDSTDTLCVSLSSSSSYDVLDITAAPVTAGRGPTLSFSVHAGGKTCKSLATAYEDSKYTYYGILAYDTVCRCGTRVGGEFYS